MLDPLAAPAALSVAVDPLLELLQDVNHEPFVELLQVVPVSGTATVHGRMRELAQAVHDAGGRSRGYRVTAPVHPFVPPRAWRDVLRREVTEGFLQPATRYPTASARTAEEIRRAGELSDGAAGLIEAHLGPVRIAGDVGGPHLDRIRWRNLLLVSEAWATILHLSVSD
ncbi:hypothetical protein ACFCX4_27380 [Kitasatospora sp. NPDC056327]|uniref:hypothetical protein n=1 Tax=Kitasatospora sp. NPDC056327 TaxID=3345785 RepID=UPI0035E05D00